MLAALGALTCKVSALVPTQPQSAWYTGSYHILNRTLQNCCKLGSIRMSPTLHYTLRIHWPSIQTCGLHVPECGQCASVVWVSQLCMSWVDFLLWWLPLSPGVSSWATMHFTFYLLSVAMLLPISIFTQYMFHLSPQSTAINALLMCCLSYYLYSFHLCIDTATLDVLRLAFAI